MRISTQISTQIVLSPEELREAVINYVMAGTDVPESPTISVDYEDDEKGDLQAVVDIKAGAATEAKPQPKAKPGRKAKASTAQNSAPTQPEEPEEANAGEGTGLPAADPEAEDTAGEVAATEAEAAKPPFDVDEKIEADPIDPSKVPAAAAPLKIFPDSGTSAAPSAPAPEPVNPAKSLFANLTKPTAH